VLSRSNPTGGRRVEQHRLVEVEGEFVVLADPHVGIDVSKRMPEGTL
jgi:hypothetical protein